jgi:hypothetical protein
VTSARETGVMFSLDDPARRLHRVRLWQEVRIPGDRLDFAWDDGVWSLGLERPGVDRMEYLFEITHPDGRTETILDPRERAPGRQRLRRPQRDRVR